MTSLRHSPERQTGATLLWWLSSLALLIVLALAGAPFMVKWYLESWLRDQDVVNVSIDDIDLNPFAGRFAIESISYEDGGQQRKADYVSVDLEWSALAQRRVRLAIVRIEGASLSIRRSESEGMFLGSIALGAAQAAQSAEDTQQASGWGFGIDRLELKDVAVDYVDPLVEQRVLFEELAIRGFATWNPGQMTHVHAMLSAEEQGLAVDGELAPLAQPWILDLQVRGRQLQVTRLGPFLISGDDVSSDGVLETDLRVEIEASDDLSRLQLSVTGTAGLQEPVLVAAGTEIRADSASWDGAVEVGLLGDQLSVTVDGVLLGRRIDASVAGSAARVTAGDVNWQGQTEYATDPQSQRLTASGNLTTDGLAAGLAPSEGDIQPGSAPASFQSTTLELQADALRLARDAAGLEAAWDGSLTLGEATMTREPLRGSLAGATWRGQTGLAVAGETNRLQVNGSLNTRMLILSDDETPVQSVLETLDWTGSASADLAADGLVDMSGALAAGEFSVRRRPDGPALLEVGALRGSLGSGGSPRVVSFQSLQLNRFAVFERPDAEVGSPDHVLQIPEIEVDGLDVGAAQATVGDITLRDARVWLERVRDGSVSLGPSVAVTDVEPPGGDPRVAPQTDDRSAYRISLAGLNTAGDTRLDFVDHSVSPSVALSLTPLTVRLGQLATTRPETGTDLHIDTEIGQFTTLTFEGVTKPLAPAFVLQGQGTIRSLDLVALDGYARRNTSHRVNSGTLRADLEVDLADDRLDSLATLEIFNLEMTPLTADEKDAYSEQLGVPLTTALNLLRDKEDNITLDVPLEGDVANLQAGIGGALRVVLNKGIQAGIKTAATTYFAPLWPALAASKLLTAASNLRFRPVEFAPGQDDLGAEQQAYLSEMEGIILNRPKLSLTVCGRAVGSDLTALFPGAAPAAVTEEQSAVLLDLARRRHTVIKSRLVEAGVEPSRVVTCAPLPSPADTGAPRADFGV